MLNDIHGLALAEGVEHDVREASHEPQAHAPVRRNLGKELCVGVWVGLCVHVDVCMEWRWAYLHVGQRDEAIECGNRLRSDKQTKRTNKTGMRT